jgi:hypothetical protein
VIEGTPSDSTNEATPANAETVANYDNENPGSDLESGDALAEPVEPAAALAKAAKQQEQQQVAEAAPLEVSQQATEDTMVGALPEEPAPEDDPVMRMALFGTATPLPDIDSLRPLPFFRPDASGPLVVQFQLNEAGKITELERVTVTAVTEADTTEGEEAADEAEGLRVDNDPAVDRLLRKMRRIRFRPQYAEGVAVDTGMIVWSFDPNPSVPGAMALQP